MRGFRWPIPSAIAFVIASAGAAPAALFVVDSEDDAVDAAPGDGVCAAAGAACTLRAAVMEANLLPGADEIQLPAGTFPLSIAGIGEDAAASGDLDVAADLVLAGAGAGVTTIDALGREAAIEVVGTVPPFGPVIVRDLTITGGAGPGTVRAVGSFEGSLTIERVVLRDNAASLGAMQCVFAHCIARDSSILDTFGGAGIFGGPVQPASFSIRVERSVIARNQGGGTFMASGLMNTAEVLASSVSDNGGDGVFCTDGPCIVEDSWIDGNAGAGVAMAVERGPVIRRSIISHNGDSGVRNANAAVVTLSTIEDSAIVGNRSETGAGGVDSFFTQISIRNTTISSNVGATVGGVAVRSLLSGTSIEWNTIVGNEGAEVGGASLGTSEMRVVGNLVAGNSGPVPDCEMGSDFIGWGNLIGDATGCPEGLAIAAFAGTAAQPLDPHIGPLHDNGGPTPTHALLPGSPALDAVLLADCTQGDPPQPLASDQRGVTRPQGAGCDIGAYEAVPEPAPLAGALTAVAALAAGCARRSSPARL
jgi:CSLREA domain-containing protein